MKQVILIFVCTLLLASCSNGGSKRQQENTSSTLENQLIDVIAENFGQRVEVPKQAVDTVEFNEENGKLKIVITTLPYMEESIEEFKMNILDSCIILLQEVQMNEDVQDLSLLVELPTEDNSGSPIDAAVYSIDFTHDKLSKINFDELDPKDLRKKAEFFFEGNFY